MAERPIFIVGDSYKMAVVTENIQFVWHAGMSKSQRQKSVYSLHRATKEIHPSARILEASRMSEIALGNNLSAFNLTFDLKDKSKAISVESAFHAAKVFERGGPFTDLLEANPLDAKRDQRLVASGALTGFRSSGINWPNEPKTAFYDWLYINALYRRPKLASEVVKYDVFTDIAFNPKKSFNCQAHSAALFVFLERRGELTKALHSQEAFLKMHMKIVNESQESQSFLQLE